MRYVTEFRDPALAQALVRRIRRMASRPIRIMEFCGGHTHAIMKYGIRQMLAPHVEMVSGPGCPVCVTSDGEIDHAIALASQPDAILTTFGDMLKVPGSRGSLEQARADGADVRIVYSPLDALTLACRNPGRTVIFLGIGFETTAPTIAATLLRAEQEAISNFLVLSLHKLTPPAMRAVLDAGDVRLDAILGPGHVTTVIGAQAWRFLPEAYGIPCAIAGFEPLDILQATARLVEMVQTGQAGISNDYARSVRQKGNPHALATMERVFQVADADWRGFGIIPQSGLRLRDAYTRFDAARRFAISLPPPKGHGACLCGDVLRGTVAPPQCPLFGRACTPERPIGPCMVSAEGACAAYFHYDQPLEAMVEAVP